jgi:cystathionine beta-lyase/cystathionine gamma-synthase
LSTHVLRDSTIAIHGGRSLDSHASSILFPLYQTGAFVHDAVGVDKGFSLITHPSSTAHADLEPELRRLLGISDTFVRFSVGLEAPEDIIADLEQAFAAANCGAIQEEVFSEIR